MTRDGAEHFGERMEMGLFTNEKYEEAFARQGWTWWIGEEGPMGRGLYVAQKP